MHVKCVHKIKNRQKKLQALGSSAPSCPGCGHLLSGEGLSGPSGHHRAACLCRGCLLYSSWSPRMRNPKGQMDTAAWQTDLTGAGVALGPGIQGAGSVSPPRGCACLPLPLLKKKGSHLVLPGSSPFFYVSLLSPQFLPHALTTLPPSLWGAYCAESKGFTAGCRPKNTHGSQTPLAHAPRR